MALGVGAKQALFEATRIGSCDQRKARLECTDVVGSGWDPAMVARECKGVFGEQACAQDNLVGTCTVGDGTGTEKRTVFYAGLLHRDSGELFEPTKEEWTATCAERGGTYAPVGR